MLNRLVLSSLRSTPKVLVPVRFATKAIKGKVVRKAVKTASSSGSNNLAFKDPWVSVRDEVSGKIYWWNQTTDETTALDAPKPVGNTAVSHSGASVPPAVYAQSQPQSFGGMLAQGMAIGAGVSMGHHLVGSFFGGGSSGSTGAESSGGDSGGGGEWDV